MTSDIDLIPYVASLHLPVVLKLPLATLTRGSYFSVMHIDLMHDRDSNGPMNI